VSKQVVQPFTPAEESVKSTGRVSSRTSRPANKTGPRQQPAADIAGMSINMSRIEKMLVALLEKLGLAIPDGIA
jgi:hypothetical protein